MINFCFGYQADLKSHGVDADAVFNILAKARDDKSSRFFPNLPRNAHVKAARVKLPYSFFHAPYAPCSKRRCHGVADGFLDWGKGCGWAASGPP